MLVYCMILYKLDVQSTKIQYNTQHLVKEHRDNVSFLTPIFGMLRHTGYWLFTNIKQNKTKQQQLGNVNVNAKARLLMLNDLKM